MSAPVFSVPVSPIGLSLDGGAMTCEHGEPVQFEFTPGYSGNDVPSVRHRILWGDGREETTEMLPAGRRYRYARSFQEAGTYTVRVVLLNSAGETSDPSGSVNPDSLFVFRYEPLPERQRRLYKWSGMAFPFQTVGQAVSAVDTSFPDVSTWLSGTARKGETRIPVVAVPEPAEGAIVTIVQPGRFISTGTVMSTDGQYLELDAELSDHYDAGLASVTVRRNDLPRGAFEQIEAKPANWLFPVTVDKDLVRSSLAMLFATRPYERVMRPGLGCRIHELTFEQNDFVARQIYHRYLLDTARQEPRASLEQIEVGSSGDEMVARTRVAFAGFTDEIFEADIPLSTHFGNASYGG